MAPGVREKVDIKFSTKPIGNQVDGNNDHDNKPQRQSGKLVVVINIVLVGSITYKFHCN